MKVLLSGVHLSLSDRLRAHVEKHLVSALERFYDDPAAELDVQLVDSSGRGGEDKECRITFFAPHSKPIHIVETTDDLFKSIDLARDRLERLVKRELEKKRAVTGHPPENQGERRRDFLEEQDALEG